jgi:hypothetical protein
MTEKNVPMADIDLALDAWFRQAPRLSAERVVAAAMTDVAKTPQPRSLFAVDATVFRVGLIAATVAALAIGLGLGLRPYLIGTDASPTPSIGPAASDESSSLVPYTNSELGYQLLLPPAWVASAEPWRDPRAGVPPGTSMPGVVRFGDSDAGGLPALMISVGTEDGEVMLPLVTAPPAMTETCRSGICRQQTVASLEELDEAVTSAPSRVPTSTTEVVVDGEAGRIESPASATCDASGCQFYTGSGVMWLPGRPLVLRTVVFLHEGRPFVLAFDYFSASRDEVLAIVESFRFLDATASPEASDAGLIRYTMEEGGYEISVPAAWQVRNDLFGDGGFYTVDPSLPVAGWGRALERQYVALMTISVGDSQGRIRLSKTGASLPTYEVGTTI